MGPLQEASTTKTLLTEDAMGRVKLDILSPKSQLLLIIPPLSEVTTPMCCKQCMCVAFFRT